MITFFVLEFTNALLYRFAMLFSGKLISFKVKTIIQKILNFPEYTG